MLSDQVACATDDLVLTRDSLIVRGWAMAASEAERLLVRWPNGLHYEMPREQWCRSSPDVGLVFGDAGGNVRFDLTVPIPPDVTLQDIVDLSLEYSAGAETRTIGLEIRKGRPSALWRKPLSSIKVGVGITTYNRASAVLATMKQVVACTDVPSAFVVADDGSTDDTLSVLEQVPEFHVISGPNRGVAWNKNRVLYYLHEIAQCDVSILLEDDTRPVEEGWQISWVVAALLYGHVNLRPSWFPPPESGRGSWADPFRSNEVTAQCSAFSRDAVRYAGYFDARFKGYGHEHVEHTSRLIRLGYGGEVKADGGSKIFYLIHAPLEMADVQSFFSQESVSNNFAIFSAIHGEISYRNAWATEQDLMDFRHEMERST